jgi:hypothetical protein
MLRIDKEEKQQQQQPITNKKMTTATIATATTNNTMLFDDNGSFDVNNISQFRICTDKYMHIHHNCYILCIPCVPYTTTKMDVARAVENQILTLGNGKSSEIKDFKYVQNVTFVRAFDQDTFDTLTSTTSKSTSSSASASNHYYDPWYKVAIVNVHIPPSYNDKYAEFYAFGEDAFYTGVCRGDIVINSWCNAFFLAHPNTYFQPAAAIVQQKKTSEKNEDREYQDGAFQKWVYEFKLKQLERKVKEHENTIRQHELDTITYQNTINDYAESMRFLTRKTLSQSSELHGLTCSSNQVASYISALNNRYARVCISDTSFLEVNRNMKLKEMNGHVIHACDDCDACQELVHSIDHARAEDREEVFYEIEKMVCRINKSVQKFEKLHLHAERSLFGLRNRRVFEDFGAYLNTALEIVEEVTSRVGTFTQDLEYARCYGKLYYNNNHRNALLSASASSSASKNNGYSYRYNYDYAEDADQVEYEGDDNDNDDIESTRKILQYFDEHHQELYKDNKEQEQQQQEQQQQEQQQQEQQQESSSTLNAVGSEEAVIIEGEEEYTTKGEKAKEPEPVSTAVAQETRQNKKSGWLSSWF